MKVFTLSYIDKLVFEDQYDTALSVVFSTNDSKQEDVCVRLTSKELAEIMTIVDAAVEKVRE